MKRRSLGIFITLIALLLSCATTGPGGKKSVILISDSQEVGLGQEFDKEVRSQNTILADQDWQNYFNRIGQSIVAVCDRPNIEYHFTVIKSDDINAFATPGGYVYIYTGLLKLMDTEAELAAVTAHEVSHIVARHGVKQLQQVMGINILLSIVMGQSDSKTLQTAIGLGLNIAMSGYSRENEREADEYGILYMTKAGYNPEGAVDMFEKLASVSGDKRNFFENMLASHPETQERIDNAKAEIAQLPDDPKARDLGKGRYELMKGRLK